MTEEDIKNAATRYGLWAVPYAPHRMKSALFNKDITSFGKHMWNSAIRAAVKEFPPPQEPEYIRNMLRSLILLDDDIKQTLRDSAHESLRDMVSLMLEQKADRMEVVYIHDGKRINVEISILGVKDEHP